MAGKGSRETFAGDAEEASSARGLTRRGALAGAALFGAGVAFDRVLSESRGGDDSAGAVDVSKTVEFHGVHQAGISTPAPEFLHFAAFDVTSSSVDDLRGILQEWTLAAASLTGGQEYQPAPIEATSAPVDTGEAIGLGPQRLTLTFGFGSSLLGSRGTDRFSFAGRRPKTLVPLPDFTGEDLDPALSGGDLCVQACAEHPQVAFHAVHVLAGLASGAAVLRWSQSGFGRTSSTSRSQPTPRNLMGFKDGTNNIRGEDEGEMDKYVWVQPGDGPAWMEGGTYMVVRRIKMLLDVWDATSLEGQERAIGREKESGAPLEKESEYDPVDLDARAKGELVIPTDAHIRLASPDTNGGQRILRRGFSYTEPSRAGSGQLDAGLFFISFQRDPQRQFVPIQRRLAANDALSRHLLHTGSGVFACPPGVQPGGFIGEALFV